MATTGQKWAIGCGVALVLVLAALGGIGTCAYMEFRGMGEQIDTMEAASAELNSRFGPAESWTPDPQAALPFSEVATFVAVRESLVVAGADLVARIRIMEGDPGAGFLEKARAWMAFIPGVLGYLAARDAALLEAGLHPGAYLYLYSTAYLAWLGHDPATGPDLDVHTGDGEGTGVQFDFGGSAAGEAAEAGRGDHDTTWQVRRTLNRTLTPVLENQLAELRARGHGATPWADRLAGEIDRLQADALRLPWQDGLPAELAASLAPFRTALEATWVPELNVLAIIGDQDREH